jgi:hypothetical protein
MRVNGTVAVVHVVTVSPTVLVFGAYGLPVVDDDILVGLVAVLSD